MLFRDHRVARCRGKILWLAARPAMVRRDPHHYRKSATRGWNWIESPDVPRNGNWQRSRVGWYQNESIRPGNPIWASSNVLQNPTVQRERRATKNLSTIDISRRKHSFEQSLENFGVVVERYGFAQGCLAIYCKQSTKSIVYQSTCSW